MESLFGYKIWIHLVVAGCSDGHADVARCPLAL